MRSRASSPKLPNQKEDMISCCFHLPCTHPPFLSSVGGYLAPNLCDLAKAGLSSGPKLESKDRSDQSESPQPSVCNPH